MNKNAGRDGIWVEERFFYPRESWVAEVGVKLSVFGVGIYLKLFVPIFLLDYFFFYHI